MISSRLTGQWEGGHAGRFLPAITSREGFYFPTTSIPAGSPAPQSGGIPAIESGSLATRRVQSIQIDGAAIGALGVGIVANADISINATALGGLIAGGVAVGSISVNASAQIVAAISGSATAGIVIGATAQPSALAKGSATASIVIHGEGELMGLGFMVASTEDNTTVTPASIANAVWKALASLNNDPGTMGELLNSSGAGGNPWIAPIDGVYTAGDIMRILAAIAAGKTSGHPTNPVFRDLGDTINRVIATIDVDGNRTVVMAAP
jgi:hypothetical protein